MSQEADISMAPRGVSLVPSSVAAEAPPKLSQLDTLALRKQRSLWGNAWRQFRRHHLAMAGLVVIVFFLLATFIGSEVYPRATDEILRSIVAAQKQAQPFVYPRGLIEIPMSPISDVGAFRNGRWPLESFLTAVRRGLEWCLENRAVFDFLCHPSCMYVVDPEFRTIALICDVVRRAGNRAMLTDLTTIARRVAPRTP